jgi:hypothetical protein
MSPFKSKAQMRFLFAKKPKIAKRWAKEFPNQNRKALPQHVEKENHYGK